MALRKAAAPAKKPRKAKAEGAGLAVPKKIGRPHGYTEEIGKQICDFVAQRTPVYEICAMPDMPSKDTLYRWKREISTFADNYMRARELRADARQDHIEEITRDARDGKITTDLARLLIDVEKWQMGKEKPKAYGDKVALTDADGGVLQIRMVA